MREIASLVGLEVVSTREGKSLGTISEVLIDLAAGKMVGVILGRGPAEKGIRAAELEALGTDVVMVKGADVADHLSAMPELLEHRQRSEPRPPEVITSDGRRLGQLAAVYINPQNHKVTRFEVSGGTWKDLTDGIISLPIVKGIIHGPDVVIIPAKVVSRSDGKGGLRAAFRQLADSTEIGYRRAAQRTERLYEKSSHAVREGMAGAREQAQHLAQEIKDTTSGPPAEEDPAEEKSAKKKSAKKKPAKKTSAKKASAKKKSAE